jgi:hypothetical protein
MNTGMLEQLLNEEEGSALDFKREQYPFYGASDQDKSEILKDVLAFANAWRRAPAYILLGVDENPGSRALVVGVTEHLKDADLQQFINTKTQRPVSFAYSVQEIEGKQVGIIEIPVQPRPLFVRKRFGKVEADTVYVRRGSSTALAAPDEVARMGAAEAAAETPSLTMEFAVTETRTPLGDSVVITSTSLKPIEIDEIRPRSVATFGLDALNEPDDRYYEQLISFTREQHLYSAVGFAVTNNSTTVAIDVKARAMIQKESGLYVTDWLSRRPSKHRYWHIVSGFNQPPIQSAHRNEADPEVYDRGTQWEVTIPFGTIHPRETSWTAYHLFVGADRSLTIPVEFRLSAENLPNPVTSQLTLEIESTTRQMTAADTEESGS